MRSGNQTSSFKVNQRQWLTSRLRYTMPLRFISAMTWFGGRPATEMAYTPLQKRSVGINMTS